MPAEIQRARRVRRLYAVRHLAQPGERRVGVATQGRDGHDPAQVEVGRLADRVGERRGVLGSAPRPAPRGRVVEGDLQQHAEATAGRVRAPVAGR